MVYIDTMQAQFKNMVMSHMIADSIEELHEMADKLGLKRGWFQNGSMPHYDIAQSKRNLAIKLGAKEITRKELVEIIKNNRGEK